jgi:hypothetical protein
MQAKRIFGLAVWMLSGCAASATVDGRPGTNPPEPADTAGEDGGSSAPAAGTSGEAAGASSKGDGGPAPAAAGGAVGRDGGGATTVVINGGSDPTMLPTAPEPCPMLTTSTVTILGTHVQLWVGAKSDTQKGPIFIYWHGTGGQSSNATFDMPADETSAILGAGGIIAAPNESTKMGNDTGNSVWYTGDFAIADEVVACAIQQLHIDTRRIYAGGTSAGGLQSGVMAYARSGYLAASTPNSGGIAWPGQDVLQDPSHVTPVLTMHGAMGSDVVVIDFATASMNLDMGLASKGGFAVDCNDGGGHAAAPADLRESAWQFLRDHPFKVTPEPYAGGLPSSFPSYCKIIH